MTQAADLATGEILDPPPSTAVVAFSTSVVPRGAPTPGLIEHVSAAHMREAMDAWQALGREILDEDDVIQIGNRLAKKKSAWRKFDVAFNVSNELRSKYVERDPDTNKIVRATVISRSIAPNGRYRDGVGVCDVHERCCDPETCRLQTHWEDSGRATGHIHCDANCPGDTHFSHAEHDIVATAHTRSSNRASSDLYGFGEVSAEELEGEGEGRQRVADEVRGRNNAQGRQQGQSRGGQQGQGKPATQKQRDLLTEKLMGIGVPKEHVGLYLEKIIGHPVAAWQDVSTRDASRAIKAFIDHKAPRYDPADYTRPPNAPQGDETAEGSDPPAESDQSPTEGLMHPSEPPEDEGPPPEGFSSWDEFDAYRDGLDDEPPSEGVLGLEAIHREVKELTADQIRIELREVGLNSSGQLEVIQLRLAEHRWKQSVG
jgi:hypothetical protein